VIIKTLRRIQLSRQSFPISQKTTGNEPKNAKQKLQNLTAEQMQHKKDLFFDAKLHNVYLFFPKLVA